MITNNRFLVINCENSQAWRPISFHTMFVDTLSREGDEWSCVDITKDEVPQNALTQYHGIVITGSHYNVRDNLPWYNDLYTLIRAVSESEDGYPRLYGGCFGCQVIAAALGGTVDRNPGQRFILRAEDIKPITPFFREVFQCVSEFESMSHRVIVSHGDCVVDLPPTAMRIATSDSCVNEMFVAGRHRNILACQSHPEFKYEYAIRERIWPRVVEQRGSLSQEEVAKSKLSFEVFSDSDAAEIAALISDFIHSQ